MKHFTSCGFLIQSQNKYLLCHPSNLRVGKLSGDKGWGLPKGKLDKPDETLLTCALRETQEETSLDLLSPELNGNNLIIGTDPIYSTEYITTFQGEQITKTVHIFHAHENTGILQTFILWCPSLVEGTNIPEMDGFRWVTKEEALKMCGRSIKDLFENVEKYTK